MTYDKLELEAWEPSFEQISNRDSPFYDERWFESELLPSDHEWFEIIGDFLLMCATIRRYEYTGKNPKLADQQRHHFDKFKELIPEIEDLIRGGYDSIEFAQKWAELQKAYNASGAVKREQSKREDRGRFDRGTEQRRAWYASVYLLERAKGKTGSVIKRDIAKFAELIKAGIVQAPPLWRKLKFDKILHEKSSLTGPQLNNDLRKDMNSKKDIPYYAEHVAPTFELPPFEIKLPASY